ncbi:MAG TPA: prolyl oligopeptidase family serine peptidase [Acidimicrobiia bacterium]|nr:prolyl oligopeptidase family serine peptidase [Acidimicrobiia bacterium]
MRRTRWFLAVLVVLMVVFHIGGGWYFSDQLRVDALEVRASEDAVDVVVTDVGDGRVGLRPLEDDDGDLTDPEVMGLDWETGYGQLFDILAENPDGAVMRRLVRIDGDLPAVGDTADLEGTAFPPDPGRAFGLLFKEVEYSSPLGEMSAWEVLSGTGPWVIHVHGLHAPRAEALRLVGPIATAGFHQLIIDFRNDEGQPADPSGYYKYGETEWEDVAAAVDYAVGKGAIRVVLVGYSTGAAHILSYLYRSTSTPVVAVVLDSPNVDFERTVDLWASQRSLPFVGLPLPPTLTWTAKKISSFRFGVDWGSLDYVSRASELRVPVLIFHGSEDETVPLSISRDLAEARNDLVRLVIVPEAGHVRSWNAGPESYERRLLAFLQEMR